MNLKFDVFARIERPVKDVFAAIYEPRQLEKYFTTGSASGPLDKGKTVFWDFADFPGKFPVMVKESIPNERIVLEWASQEGGYNTTVEIKFEPQGPRATKVTISESGWRETPKGLESSYGNCMGWTQMLCCLKVYLEHGINLREGFFKPAQKAA